MLELLKGSNSVELKVIVPQGHRGAIPALGFDPVEAEPRQTYFFDTPDLALNKAGLIVRARRSPKGKGDTVVKLRPIDPAAIEAELRHDEAFKIEVDVNPRRLCVLRIREGPLHGAGRARRQRRQDAAAVDLYAEAARLLRGARTLKASP